MKKLVLVALLLIFASSACADITSPLVAWWKMDGPTDPANPGIVKDYSGYGNDGTMGSADTWLPGGGINFDGGNWGASGIVFANDGADLIADLGLTSQVTISYWATWDAFPARTNYPYDGRDSAGLRILSSEQPTNSGHIRDHKGGADMWLWEAFDETSENFIYETWGDWIWITTTANFDTGDINFYVNNELYQTASGKTGSFEDLATFTIGRTLWSGMEGYMADFRIYDRELSAEEAFYYQLNPPPPIPEPATLALLSLGGLALLRRKIN